MLMQRSNVVLPEPLGPMTTTASPGATASEIPRSTWLAPKLFTMPAIASMGRGWVRGGSVANEGASLKVASIQGHRVTDHEIDCRGTQKYLKWRQRAFHHLTARHRQFPQANDGNQRGRLHQVGAQADEGWRRQPQCLRQDDDAHQQMPLH